ncbi:MAG: hypothetical protein KDI13_02995 [Alphaproteobacteria bacterium]|nr:hypothetical protein [Alphaproteobacteria bacterium]
MSDSRNMPIENAAQVIERFGGIRPMSSKINVPVTTIQGWKKRGVIPANRRDDLLEAANENEIDLSDLVDGAKVLQKSDDAVAEDVAADEPDVSDAEEKADEPEEADDASEDDEAGDTDTDGQDDEDEDEDEDDSVEAEVAVIPVPSFVRPEAVGTKDDVAAEAPSATALALEAENKSFYKSVLIGLLIIVLGGGLVGAFLWSQGREDTDETRISDLEGALSEVRKQQTSFKGLVPEDWAGQVAELKKEVAKAKEAVGTAAVQARDVSGEIINQAGHLEDHLSKLESYVNDITKSNAVAGVWARIQMMKESVPGRDTLEQASHSLYGLVMTQEGDEESGDTDISSLLMQARTQSDALGKTFKDVPQEDLKAAAMLLAMAQMRDSLNRNDKPFADDLKLLQKIAGKDNPELQASLLKLAPYAESGVLTPSGLSDEFRGLAGDVVVSSLNGEDVSIADKAKARMNDLFQVEKDGELLTGTPTQAVVNRAQNRLDEGDIAGALEALQSLDPQDASVLGSWMEQAEGTMAGMNAMRMIRQAIGMTVGNGYLGGSELLDQGGLEVQRK